MKHLFFSIGIALISISCIAQSDSTKDSHSIDGRETNKRKAFQYTDTTFEVGEVKNLFCVYYIIEGKRPDSIPSLDSLQKFLVLHPEIQIEIGSHTDSKGADSYNLKLSEYRAKSDYDYLISKGVPPSQITYEGYGETQPIAPNQIDGKDNYEGQRKNRRTEAKIISIRK